MEQELDIKQQLAAWLAAPEKVSGDNAVLLKDLTARYPYFQPLHLLLAKATLESPEQHGNLATAALYTSGTLLHHLLHAPEQLIQKDFKVINLADPAASQPELIDVDTIDEVPSEPEEHPDNADEQEVFEEIGEVDIKAFEQTTASSKPEADFVIENIVSSDFFAFQDNFKVESSAGENAPETEQPAEAVKGEEPAVISKYDDDQLPYTFLWWLAKTRKEHQQIFQPYASPKKKETEDTDKPGKQPRPSELQHQYV